MFPASPADGGLGSFRSGMMQYEFEKHNGFALHSLDDVDDDLVSSPDDNTSPPSGVSSLGLARGAHPCSKAGTVEVLRPEEIRWFYKAEGDRKWTTFDGYDSQRIEFKHRELEQLRPADAGTEGPDQPTDPTASGGDPRLPAGELGPAGDSGDDTVSVRGGLYQVDVLKRTCFPIYWSAEGELAYLCEKSITQCAMRELQYTMCSIVDRCIILHGRGLSVTVTRHGSGMHYLINA